MPRIILPMTGEALYKLYQDKCDTIAGAETDDWDDLENDDQLVWDDLAGEFPSDKSPNLGLATADQLFDEIRSRMPDEIG